MEEAITAAIIFSGAASGNAWLFATGILMFILLLALGTVILRHRRDSRSPVPQIRRAMNNPVLEPIRENPWESEAVFNPAAIYENGRVHLLYRALGADGVSRIGYATSEDGIHFDERLSYPVFVPEIAAQSKYRNPFTSPARYDRDRYASGGGWGGSEDPRMVSIDGRIHVTFNIFNGWNEMRIGLLSIDREDFRKRDWRWNFNHLSAPGRQKNWVLFPEKIGGKYAIFHNLYHKDPTRVAIEFVDEIEVSGHLPPFESHDPQGLPDRILGWHNRTRSAGPPPIKTPQGWLLLYHAMDKDDPNRYKLGALLLDLNDPTKVLFRSKYPILAPDMHYENDWKPGIIYASGAIVKDGELFIYYGGGDKTVNVATAHLDTFLSQLSHGEHAVLQSAV